MKFKKFAMAVLAITTLTLGMALPASADTTDKWYYKENVSAGSWEGTQAAYKETTTEVYVNPRSAPSGVSKVQTMCYVGGQIKSKNTYGDAYCTSGQKYAINNYVYEHGDYTSGRGVQTWLGVTHNSYTGNMTGYWSPDYAYEDGVNYV